MMMLVMKIEDNNDEEEKVVMRFVGLDVFHKSRLHFCIQSLAEGVTTISVQGVMMR